MPPAVIHADPEVDLAPFSGYLTSRGVPHRIYRESHAQVLELNDPGRAAEVKAAFDAWRAGRLVIERAAATRRRGGPPGGIAVWLRVTPAVCALLAVAWLSFFALDDVFAWFTFVPPERLGPDVSAMEELARFEVWRWVTPILLHFGVLHIVFNSLVVFELGRRVELRAGATAFLVTVLVIAVFSNVAQFIVSIDTPFGGLSGVAYGLLGAVLVAGRLAPEEPLWQLPHGIAVGLLGFLVFFSTGITEHLGDFSISIANTAHWAGLVTGAAIGVALGRMGARTGRPRGMRV
jgi:GlpG protein